MGIYLGDKSTLVLIALGGAALVGGYWYMTREKKTEFANYDPRYPDRYISPVVFMRNHAPAVRQERFARHVYNDYDQIGPYKTWEVPTWWTVSGIPAYNNMMNRDPHVHTMVQEVFSPK